MWSALPLLFALCTPSVAHAEEEDAGLWTAVLAMADSQHDEAIRRADAIRDVVASIGRGIVVDQRSVELMREVREAALEMNLGVLYRMLPESHGDSRVLRGTGLPLADGYHITWFPSAPASKGIGTEEVRVEMTPSANEFGNGQAYSFDMEGRLGTGAFTHLDAARAFEALVALLEEAARGPVSSEWLAKARAGQPSLSGQGDLAVLAAVMESMPTLAHVLERSVVLDRIGSVSSDRLSIDFDGRVDLDRLERNYPKLARYLKKMDDLAAVDVVLFDSQGGVLGRMSAWSGNRRVRIRFDCHDGALVPLGAPIERSVRPSDPRVDMAVSVAMEAKSDGMLLRIKDYVMPVVYRQSDAGATLALDVRTEPDISFDGASAFTSWLVDLADNALNLEEHASVVFEAVAHGPEGEGTRLRGRWSPGTQGQLTAGMQLELVDNGLIRFGMRIVGRHMVPNDEVIAEMLGLMSEVIGALDADYTRARPALIE